MQLNLYECMYLIVFSYFLPNKVFGNCQATRLVSCFSRERGEKNGEQMLDDDDDFIKHFEIGHMQL